jgi:putative transposase
MAFWRLYYHLVWATKGRAPMITPEKEAKLYPYIIGKADTLNCIIHACDGIEDHIHLVISIPPHLSISELVKLLKGSSSHHLNQIFSNNPDKFGWQEGYGVFSLGQKQLGQAVAYVINQKIHHQQGSINSYLEQITNQDDPPSRWTPNEPQY